MSIGLTGSQRRSQSPDMSSVSQGERHYHAYAWSSTTKVRRDCLDYVYRAEESGIAWTHHGLSAAHHAILVPLK